MSLWPTRRAWAGLGPESPSSVPEACAAIAVLCNEVFPYCSSSSSQNRERAGTVWLWGKKWLTFLYLCFLKPKPLALIGSQWEQLAVSFFTVLQGNILQVCMYLQPCTEGGHRHLPGRGQCPQSWLRGQKWWKRTVCLSWESDLLAGLTVALQTESWCSRWLSWERKGFCRELESDFLDVSHLCSCNCRKHLHALHHFVFQVRKLLSCSLLGMCMVNCRADVVLWGQTPSCFHLCLVAHLYLPAIQEYIFCPSFQQVLGLLPFPVSLEPLKNGAGCSCVLFYLGVAFQWDFLQKGMSVLWGVSNEN